jgi:phosphosulfolactate synthase (CoM biosynthesis protein A)
MGHAVNKMGVEAGKKIKKEEKEQTVAERLQQIRINVEAGLYVPLTEVELLLQAFDETIMRAEAVEQKAAELQSEINKISEAVSEAVSEVITESRAHIAMEELETIPSPVQP